MLSFLLLGIFLGVGLQSKILQTHIPDLKFQVKLNAWEAPPQRLKHQLASWRSRAC